MKLVLQRVKEARVEVGGKVMGGIKEGICLLVGIEKGDTEEDVAYLADKVVKMRIFPDGEGKMNLSLKDIEGRVLAVSQFTLAGSLEKGRRPSFDNAEKPERAKKLFDLFAESVRENNIEIETGVFAASMDVHLINDGPVTFVLESRRSLT